MTCEMAIPFNLPSDEQTEENNRRLDQLLRDLYSVLRQILLRRTNETVAAAVPSRGEEPAPVAAAPSRSGPVAEGDATRSRRPVLPDVVASAVCQCQCARRAQPQRRHRRRRRPSCCHAEQPVILPAAPAPDPADDNWLVIGLQLKKIAEELKIAFLKQEVSREREREESVKLEVKTSSLFSLLVPTHLRGSIWTTVILLVGWRLLVRSR